MTLYSCFLKCCNEELIQMAKAVQIPVVCNREQLAQRLTNYYADFGVDVNSLLNSPDLYPQLNPVLYHLKNHPRVGDEVIWIAKSSKVARLEKRAGELCRGKVLLVCSDGIKVEITHVEGKPFRSRFGPFLVSPKDWTFPKNSLGRYNPLTSVKTAIALSLAQSRLEKKG